MVRGAEDGCWLKKPAGTLWPTARQQPIPTTANIRPQNEWPHLQISYLICRSTAGLCHSTAARAAGAAGTSTRPLHILKGRAGLCSPTPSGPLQFLKFYCLHFLFRPSMWRKDGDSFLLASAHSPRPREEEAGLRSFASRLCDSFSIRTHDLQKTRGVLGSNCNSQGFCLLRCHVFANDSHSAVCCCFFFKMETLFVQTELWKAAFPLCTYSPI